MTTKPKPLTHAERRARKPGETTGRKPLPPEKRRVQRTVSFASDADQILSQAIQSEGWSRGKILDDLLRKSRS